MPRNVEELNYKVKQKLVIVDCFFANACIRHSSQRFVGGCIILIVNVH